MSILKVQKASYEISTAINKAVKEHDLSYGELFQILTEALSRWVGYLVIDERKEKEVSK